MQLVWLSLLPVVYGVVVAAIFHAFRQRASSLQQVPASFHRVLLVTAHPDDEVMFFLPLITSLVRAGRELHILCLSTGNADGLGEIRTKELKDACRLMKVPLNRLTIVDDPFLQDGMAAVWAEKDVGRHVTQAITTHNIDTVITFDTYGVSGHPNHRATYTGVRHVAGNSGDHSTQFFELESVPLVRKYSFWLDFAVSGWLHQQGELMYLDFNLASNHEAMLCHRSQYVWFRKLFVLLSRYSYINTLTPMLIELREASSAKKAA